MKCGPDQRRLFNGPLIHVTRNVKGEPIILLISCIRVIFASSSSKKSSQNLKKDDETDKKLMEDGCPHYHFGDFVQKNYFPPLFGRFLVALESSLFNVETDFEIR